MSDTGPAWGRFGSDTRPAQERCMTQSETPHVRLVNRSGLHDLPVAPNLLGRSFVAERPDTVWLADISYIATDEGFLYLAAIKDLATREIVGWSMAEHLKAGLCIDALVMALQRCQPPRGLIHHSDRGVQLGFKRSSQHLDGGGCDEGWETALGSGTTSRV